MRIGVLVVAYNAASTLEHVLDRIPDHFRPRITEVLVGDDHSADGTYEAGLRWKQRAGDLHLTVVRHDRNLGYGGNQKAGYRWAIERELDVVVLLHGDGQYAPELLPEVVGPIERGEADAVLGSRMLDPGGARRGGMPLYKFAGNRVLTAFQNRVAGTDLSEWHSGYRAYSVEALSSIPFERNSDDFDFDTEVILQLLEAQRRIVEVPIPTYYGDEICYVNGLGYARDVTAATVRYRLHKMGFGSGELAFASGAYEHKHGEGTSHARLLQWMRGREQARVLDLGCSDGTLGARLRELGHEVTGVDVVDVPGARERLDRFLVADLDHGIPTDAGRDFDVVLAADVLEHVRDPARLLLDARAALRPGGRVLACVPNFAHWYPRARVLLGRFDYDRRGILDADHVRFFTARSFERTISAAGLAVHRRENLGIPFEVTRRTTGAMRPSTASQDDDRDGRRGVLARLDAALARRRPSLFAYQFLVELAPVN